jgi:hypothetical protein
LQPPNGCHPGFRLAFAGTIEAVFTRVLPQFFLISPPLVERRKKMHTNAEWSF